jgi:hypothetical protein
MDEPKVKVSYKHYYSDRVVVGADILYPGDLHIILPNAEYFLKTGKCVCKKILSTMNGSHPTEGSPLEGNGRKCRIYGNVCDLFNEKFTEDIKLRATSRIILEKAVKMESGLPKNGNEGKKGVFGTWVSPNQDYWDKQIKYLEERGLATFNKEKEILIATKNGKETYELLSKEDDSL